VVYYLTLEAHRPPLWVTGSTRDQHAARLRAALGSVARNASLRWQDQRTLAVKLRYEVDARDGEVAHQVALARLVWASGRADLRPVRAVVTRVGSHWTQGAIAGALTGVGLSQTQDDRLGPVITLAAIAMGAAAGAFLRREVPVFRALRLPRAGWRLVAVEPETSPARLHVGLA
jgi:hypothetical protein